VRRSGRKIGAVVPVDLFGKCADLTALQQFADDLSVPLLVDAAESMGAAHRGQPSGSFGQASVFSFNGNKVMTTSGGGMLVTRDESVARRVRHLATQARQQVAHYEHTEVGYNYRLSNILAALGRAQLCRLNEMITRRREIRAAYRALFAGTANVRLLSGGDDMQDNCWLTCVEVEESAGWAAADLSAHLSSQHIEARPLWKPMHLQPVFAGCDRLVNGTSQWLFEHGLTLPSGSGMSAAEQARVLSAIGEFLGAL
jgi:dTDP-4-amino-4,6-dideoxygalactose transaminase